MKMPLTQETNKTIKLGYKNIVAYVHKVPFKSSLTF